MLKRQVGEGGEGKRHKGRMSRKQRRMRMMMMKRRRTMKGLRKILRQRTRTVVAVRFQLTLGGTDDVIGVEFCTVL